MRNQVSMLIILGAAASLLITACGKKDENEKSNTKAPAVTPKTTAPTPPTKTVTPPPKPTPVATNSAAKKEAKRRFDTLCASCHGTSGKGDGPGAAALNPKPRDYTDAKWQASVTDEQLEKIILKGGIGVGKSPTMPPSPDLENKPEVLDEMIALIRAFAEK